MFQSARWDECSALLPRCSAACRVKKAEKERLKGIEELEKKEKKEKKKKEKEEKRWESRGHCGATRPRDRRGCYLMRHPAAACPARSSAVMMAACSMQQVQCSSWVLPDTTPPACAVCQQEARG